MHAFEISSSRYNRYSHNLIRFPSYWASNLPHLIVDHPCFILSRFLSIFKFKLPRILLILDPLYHLNQEKELQVQEKEALKDQDYLYLMGKVRCYRNKYCYQKLYTRKSRSLSTSYVLIRNQSWIAWERSLDRNNVKEGQGRRLINPIPHLFAKNTAFTTWYTRIRCRRVGWKRTWFMPLLDPHYQHSSRWEREHTHTYLYRQRKSIRCRR